MALRHSLMLQIVHDSLNENEDDMEDLLDNADVEDDMYVEDNYNSSTIDDTLENAYMTDSQLTLSIFNPSYPSEAHDDIDLNYRTLQQVDFSAPEIISPDVDTDYYSEFLKSVSGSSLWFLLLHNADFKEMVNLKYSTNSNHEWFDQFLSLSSLEVANQVENALWVLTRYIFQVIAEFLIFIASRKVAKKLKPTESEQNYVEDRLYAFITATEFDNIFEELPFNSRDSDVDRIIVYDSLKDIVKQFIYSHKVLQRPTKQTPVVSEENQAYEVHAFAGWALHSSIQVMKAKRNRSILNSVPICDIDKRTLKILEIMTLLRRDITEEEENGMFIFLNNIYYRTSFLTVKL